MVQTQGGAGASWSNSLRPKPPSTFSSPVGTTSKPARGRRGFLPLRMLPYLPFCQTSKKHGRSICSVSRMVRRVVDLQAANKPYGFVWQHTEQKKNGIRRRLIEKKIRTDAKKRGTGGEKTVTQQLRAIRRTVQRTTLQEVTAYGTAGHQRVVEPLRRRCAGGRLTQGASRCNQGSRSLPRFPYAGRDAKSAGVRW